MLLLLMLLFVAVVVVVAAAAAVVVAVAVVVVVHAKIEVFSTSDTSVVFFMSHNFFINLLFVASKTQIYTHYLNDLYCVEWDVKPYYTIPIIDIVIAFDAVSCSALTLSFGRREGRSSCEKSHSQSV